MFKYEHSTGVFSPVFPKIQLFTVIINLIRVAFFPLCLWYLHMLCVSVWSNLKASISRSTFWASPWTRMWFWNFLSASSSSMLWKSISSTTQLVHKGTDGGIKMKNKDGIQQFYTHHLIFYILQGLVGLESIMEDIRVYKKVCYKGFLVIFVPWVILNRCRILMS